LVNIINIDIITSITTTTTNRNLPRPGKATEKGPENTMDSTLIHLLPNCFPSSFGHHPRLPSTTSPESQQPPPYTLNPPTIHPTPPINIPLTISLLGAPARCSKTRPLLYCLQDHVPLSPETTYQEFIDGLRVRLERLGVNGNEFDKGSCWKVGISAMGRSRSRFLWGGFVEMEVGRESWEDVMKGFGEGRFECFRVDCWRE
jgi:hypothetical protein